MRATQRLFKAIPLGLRSVAWVTDHAKAGFKLRPIYLDEVRDDELLIEMKYSGICHTVRLDSFPPPAQRMALFSLTEK